MFYLFSFDGLGRLALDALFFFLKGTSSFTLLGQLFLLFDGDRLTHNDVSELKYLLCTTTTKNRERLETYSLCFLCFLLVSFGSLGPVGRLGSLYFLCLLCALDVLCGGLAIVSSSDCEIVEERVRSLRVGVRLLLGRVHCKSKVVLTLGVFLAWWHLCI